MTMNTQASRLGRLALAAALAAACAAAGPSDGTNAPLPLATVLSESHSGLAAGRREVVRDTASWARLWAEIHKDRSPAPPPPAVDFSREMLVAAALGSRPSGGFSVAVTSVVAHGGQLDVSVLESCPARDAMVTMALTQPVHVVRVARLAGTPAFHEARGPSCP
jgi:hypothetical protein